MKSLRVTGRSKFSPEGRVTPSVRFRQAKYQEKISQKGARVAPKHNSSRDAWAFFTPSGWVILAASIITISALSWFFILGTHFLVRNVNISEGTTLTTNQFNKAFYDLEDQRILFLIPGNHILFLTENRFTETLNKHFPYIAGVENFDRDWPNSVSFKIVEKNPVFVFSAPTGQKFLVDNEGTVIGEAGQALSQNLVQLEGEISTPLYGQKLLNLPLFNLALAVQDEWLPQFEFKPARFQLLINTPDGELNLYTNEDWFIKIDGKQEAREILNNLNLILDEEVDTAEERKSLKYVDLRLSTRAFLCMKGQPCANR